MRSDRAGRIGTLYDDSFAGAFYDGTGRLGEPFFIVVFYFINCVRRVFSVVFIFCNENKPGFA